MIIRPRAKSKTVLGSDISGNISGNAANVTGVVAVPNGGTGATTLTGYVKGSGTSAFTASSTVPGSDVSGNISGNAANVTGTVAIANGGTGATTAVDAVVNLSAEYVVTTLAALKALTARPSAVTNQYRTMAGDGGGGTWVWRSGDQSANVTVDTLSGVWAAPDSDSTGASGAWQRLYAGAVNPRWFGAVGNGSANDTEAIQKAFDFVVAAGRGTVHLTAGAYKITSTVTVSSDNITLRGDGIAATFIYVTQLTTDGIKFTTSGTNQNGCMVQDIGVYHIGTDPTAGALLHFDRQTNFTVSNVSLFNGFCCAQFQSTGHGNIVNLNAQGDGNFSSYKAGSSIVAFTKHASGALPFEMHFTNCDWRGQTNNQRLHYAVFVTGCDGLWFDSCHFGMARVGVFLNPATNSTQLTAVNISNCYLDTCSEYGFLALEPSGSYSGIFGDHHLEFAQIYGCAVGIAWNCATTDWNTVRGGQWFNTTTNTVELAKGSRLSIFGADISKVNEGGAGGSGIDIDQFTLFRISDVSVTRNGGTNAPSYGIYIRSGASDFVITGFRAKDCGASLSDNSGSVTKYIEPYLTESGVLISAAAVLNTSGAALPTAISGAVLQLGGTASGTTIGMEAIAAGANINGRRTNGSVASPSAVQNGNQLLILSAGGYGSTGYSSGNRVAIDFLASENWTDSAQGTDIRFRANAVGAATLAEHVRITGGVGLKVASGYQLWLGNAYTAGAPAATGYVTIQDSTGTTYKVLVST